MFKDNKKRQYLTALRLVRDIVVFMYLCSDFYFRLKGTPL